jgi:hypothetical protein
MCKTFLHVGAFSMNYFSSTFLVASLLRKEKIFDFGMGCWQGEEDNHYSVTKKN